MFRWIREYWSRRSGSLEESVEPPTFLVVGLGNPGAKYVSTRHNVGFWILDELASRGGGDWSTDAGLEARVAWAELSGQRCLLLAPQTFMNHSGRSVAAACARWPDLDPATEVLVVYDDLDLPTGRIRLRPSGGAGGHRGMGDILSELDTKSIPRLRFGVGHPGSSATVIDWVLSPFGEEEQPDLDIAIPRAAAAVEETLRAGLPAAMGQFNQA